MYIENMNETENLKRWKLEVLERKYPMWFIKSRMEVGRGRKYVNKCMFINLQ